MSDVLLDRSFINGYPSFKDLYCGAGRKFVRMMPSGDLYRCHSANLYLGNLFEGEMELLRKTKKCIAEKCTCPYIGYRYVRFERKNLI